MIKILATVNRRDNEPLFMKSVSRLINMFCVFIETDERAADYRGLDWSLEYDLAIKGDPNDTQSAL